MTSDPVWLGGAVRAKSIEAVLIGVALWVAGTAFIGLVGRSPLFVLLAVPATLILTPVAMWGLTTLHLRGVPAAQQPSVGLRFGLLVTAAQFPLDAVALFAVFNRGFLGLPVAAQHSVVVALEIGYFWMLLTPWLITATRERRMGGSS